LERIERVSPLPASNSRVSCWMLPPSSRISIDVLDFAARAELGCALAPHGDVDVGAQVAFFHIAVAGAEIAQDRTQLGNVGLRLFGRTQVGFGDDLHERYPRAIEIDQGIVGMLIVNEFACILLQVQPLDANAVCFPIDLDFDLAGADDGLLVLGDLIALRQIGVEVIFPVEHGGEIDLGLKPEAGAHGLIDAALIDDRQHAGHGGIDQGDLGIGRRTKLGGGAREQLGL
jgi:hypothetical protein